LNESLLKIWRDWKNVITVTILVIFNTTSLAWAPIVASWFKSNPAEIEALAKNIQDTLWLVVFIYAAQIIFSNRRKRLDDKKQAEAAAAAAVAAQAESEAGEDVALLAEPEIVDQPMRAARPEKTRWVGDRTNQK